MIGNQGENLVFLLSMPRAGSTLLSLMLGSHPEVLCPPEPWIQLALAENASPHDRCRLPFDEYTATIATAEFLENIAANPGTRSSLIDELHTLFSQEHESFGLAHFAQAVYNLSLSVSGKRIFVDKTPRYYHVLDFIDRCYPSAKKIVLTRNPLDVALSYKTTWNVPIDELVGQVSTPNTVDFVKGLFDLEHYGAKKKPNVQVVAYEELVSNPEEILRKLCHFLGIEFSPQMLAYHNNADLLAAQQRSSVGDRKVLSAGRKTDTASLGKWRQELSHEEILRLVSVLGGGIFSRLGYHQTLDEFIEDGIDLPVESDAESWRVSVLAGNKNEVDTRPLLGRWAYLIASAGADSRHVGELLRLLSEQTNTAVPFIESVGEATLDLARRYRQSEHDRAKRLDEIHVLFTALKKADQERTVHLGAIDDLTDVLRKADQERTAHLGAIDDLTDALRKADQECAESTATNKALFGVLRRLPVRIAIWLFGIRSPDLQNGVDTIKTRVSLKARND